MITYFSYSVSKDFFKVTGYAGVHMCVHVCVYNVRELPLTKLGTKFTQLSVRGKY
jgi:hypothetical protein